MFVEWMLWKGGWVVSFSPSPLKTSLESGGGAAWSINPGAIRLRSCSRLKEPSHPQLFLGEWGAFPKGWGTWIELHPGSMVCCSFSPFPSTSTPEPCQKSPLFLSSPQQLYHLLCLLPLAWEG